MNTELARQLRDKVDQAWSVSWTRFFRPETNLFYDYVSSRDPALSQAHLPTADEVKRQVPNTCGWGTGMEDSAINAGVWMSTVCDRFDATGDEAMKACADQVWAGMELLMAVSKAPGFLPRSVCIEDRKSHYTESSRDQYTHFCHGLWRFYHSPLADEKQRITMRRIITHICVRAEAFVIPGDRNFSLCREDGAFSGVTKMWEVWCHEWARLPMIYLIGWDLTGNDHWRDLYRRYAWKAARESLNSPIWFRVAYAYFQAVFSLEPLVTLERDDLDLRAAWLKAMQFYAGRLEGFSWQCLNGYKPLKGEGYDLDWRHWEQTKADAEGHRVPIYPSRLAWNYETDRSSGEGETIREPGEALLAQLMVPDRPFTADQFDLLKQMLLQTDFDSSITYALFYPVAAYWRAVKRGVCPNVAS